MPQLFPIDQFLPLAQLRTINFGALGQVRILIQNLDRIHFQLGRQIFDRSQSQIAGLLMVRCAPGACAPAVCGYRGMALALVGNVEDIGNGRSASATHAARRPGCRVPGRDRAVLLSRHFYFGEA